EGQVRLRAAADLPPSGLRINSPYDAEERFGNKGSTTWEGYKVHLTETCATDEVHLLTHVDTTEAPMADADRAGPIQDALVAKGFATWRAPAGLWLCRHRTGPYQPVPAGHRGGRPHAPRQQLASPLTRPVRPEPVHHRLGGADGHLPRGADQHLLDTTPGRLEQRGDQRQVLAH